MQEGKGYKRALLKLSGEYIAGEEGQGIDFELLKKLAAELKKGVHFGLELGIVLGGGNFWRGATKGEMTRDKADYIGMLATVMNALAVCDIFNLCGLEAETQTLIAMPAVAPGYLKDRAVSQLKSGKVVIFGGGSGSPYFSTDTAAALRAIDIEADVLLKATHTVDGVYDKDPTKHKNAQKYDSLTLEEACAKHLAVMDEAAMVLCKEHKVPVRVFCGRPLENISAALLGEKLGTIINF